MHRSRGSGWLALFCVLAPAAAQRGDVEFRSSDRPLADGFAWARRQALAYVFDGDPVGPWYEAALPGRSAFCARDVSHQSTGAFFLGLAPATRNMLRKFAVNISSSRDWCTYWEIDKWDRPAPVDYTNDSDFWYCLPANFDLLSCCYRQYRLTGDRAYVDDPVFLAFYDHTVVDYIKKWDKSGRGIPEGYRRSGHRGLGSYTEDFRLHPLIGGDLVAAEYAAFLAYGAILDQRRDGRAAEYRRKAQALHNLYNTAWWFDRKNRFFAWMLEDGTYFDRDAASPFDLWFGIPAEGPHREHALDRLLGESPANVEELSYAPEIAYRYNRDAEGYALLVRLIDPKLERRDYPEVSFAVVGAIVSGTMGIQPDAARGVVATRPHLTSQTAWAELRHLPALGNQIDVRHLGDAQTTLTNRRGPALLWRCGFPVTAATLLVDRKPVAALHDAGESYVTVTVAPGRAITVQTTSKENHD